MAMNSDRSSHRTKPALSVHTSDQSGDLRGRHGQTPAQMPPAGNAASMVIETRHDSTLWWSTCAMHQRLAPAARSLAL